MDKKIWDFEKANLERVVNEIKIQLDNGINAASNYKKEAIEMQKRMHEDVKCTPTSLFDLDGAAQAWLYQADIANQARKYEFSYNMINRLERMYQSPYFGRMDFIEDGEENAEQIYIGIHSLSIGNTLEILVYDWRAPISNMFYDYEIGLCSYECPTGSIHGQMTLKRQYKIENQNIIYMFDSNLRIDDEMLQEILGKTTDNRMKTIVTSIQREQNNVIRDDKHKILIVQGAAGSGKTSIALHRAAYLLYKYRESIKSENILVFSPNHVFEDYISNVLPELGEENIQRCTFVDFFGSALDPKYKIETMNEQMEYILSPYFDEARIRSIKFKASLSFLSILKNYVQYLENGSGIKFIDLIVNGNPVISAQDIYTLFRVDYSSIPFAKRMEKLRQRLFYLLESYEEEQIKEILENNLLQENCLSVKEQKAAASQKVRTGFESIRNDILQMTSFDVCLLYSNMFRNMESFAQFAHEQGFEDINDIATYTTRQLQSNIINYEDIAPILFLESALNTCSNTKSIKHVIIDEAQDYTAIQYEIIKKAFEHCKMTILGDLNQSVNAYMNIGSFDIISSIFNMKDTINIPLTKSYRSTKEISDFCKGLLMHQDHSEQLNRHGCKPRIVKVDKSNLSRSIADDIMRLKAKGHKLIAVICKSASQCEALYKSIVSYVDISLISNLNEAYRVGVVIIPSYLAKGLEFDAVLVNSIEDTDYSKEEDRRVLYTVCTRALHELYLYYHDNLSDFVKKMDTDFYTNDALVT